MHLSTISFLILSSTSFNVGLAMPLRVNFTDLDFIFGHGVVHAPIDALSFGPLLFFERDKTDPATRKNTKATKTC